MSNFVITTDSGLNPNNEATMIREQIIKNGCIAYKDGDLTNEQILKEMKEGNTFKTSSPLLSDYFDMFESFLKEKLDIIHLSVSNGLSEGSVNSANIAANELMSEYENKIYVIDTLNGITGGTLISEYASNLRIKGLNIKDIINELNNIKTKIQTSFYVPNPEGFIKSGRDKTSMYLKDKALMLGSKVSNMASLKYRVDFNSDGNLFIKNVMRSSVKAGALKFIKNIISENTINSFDPNYVVVGNLLKKDVDMDEIIEYIDGFKYFKNIINKDINSIVACYGTEDLCGISLVKKG